MHITNIVSLVNKLVKQQDKRYNPHSGNVIGVVKNNTENKETVIHYFCGHIETVLIFRV